MPIAYCLEVKTKGIHLQLYVGCKFEATFGTVSCCDSSEKGPLSLPVIRQVTLLFNALIYINITIIVSNLT